MRSSAGLARGGGHPKPTRARAGAAYRPHHGPRGRITCFWIGTTRSRSWLKGAGYSDPDPFPAPAPAWLWLAAESATPTRQLFLHGGIERSRRRSRPDAGGRVDCNFATDVTTPGENKTCCFPGGSAAVSLRRASSRRFYCLAGHATRAWYNSTFALNRA